LLFGCSFSAWNIEICDERRRASRLVLVLVLVLMRLVHQSPQPASLFFNFQDVYNSAILLPQRSIIRSPISRSLDGTSPTAILTKTEPQQLTTLLTKETVR